MKVIVLGKRGFWVIIDEDELEKWEEDGSLSEGDLIVIPKYIYVVTEIRRMGLKPVKKEELGEWVKDEKKSRKRL